MDKIIEDDELGRLVIRVNSRARSLVFRTKSDAVYVSVPPGTTLKEVKQAIENLRGKLLASRQKIARPLIDLNYKIDAEHFKLSLVSGEKDQFLANSRLGVMALFTRSFVLLMPILQMRNCKAGCIRLLKNH